MSNKGLLYGFIAYFLWGILPLYWRFLLDVPASEILVFRIISSLFFLLILQSIRKQWSWIKSLKSQKNLWMPSVFAALLLAGNWFIYIWAINAGFVVETSLGYFINPLVNVMLGVFLLNERLRSGQWLAVGLAACGVIYLTITSQTPPWIALSLAFSFGFYGLMKKKIKLGASESLTFEMSILFIPAVLLLSFLSINGQADFGQSTSLENILLLSSGIVTALPLIFFAAAARRIPLATLGLLQYIAPTLQFLIGIYVFREPFSTNMLIGFCIIWLALVIYSIEGVWQRRVNTVTIL